MAALLRRRRKLAILLTLSLLVVGGISFSAQVQPRRGAPGLPPGVITESPTIVSGADIGFRIERTRDGIPIGKVVVRVDGRWITEMSASSVQPR